MNELRKYLRSFWKNNNIALAIPLLIFFLGVYLQWSSSYQTEIKSEDELVIVTASLEAIKQVFVGEHRGNKVFFYPIFLENYPCNFSYGINDLETRLALYKSSMPGDFVKLTIHKGDVNRLQLPGETIECFSLMVGNKNYGNAFYKIKTFNDSLEIYKSIYLISFLMVLFFSLSILLINS